MTTGIENTFIRRTIAIIIFAITDVFGDRATCTTGIENTFIRRTIAIIVFAITDVFSDRATCATVIQNALIDQPVVIIIEFVTHFIDGLIHDIGIVGLHIDEHVFAFEIKIGPTHIEFFVRLCIGCHSRIDGSRLVGINDILVTTVVVIRHRLRGRHRTGRKGEQDCSADETMCVVQLHV